MIGQRENRGIRKILKMLMPIIGPLAAIIAFNISGNIWVMIIIAWVALILFFML